MTLGGFIEYLLDNDCDIARDIDCEVLQIKRRGGQTGLPRITITYSDKKKKLRPVTICRVCHTLGLPVPESEKHAEMILIHIMEHHKKSKKKKPSPEE